MSFCATGTVAAVLGRNVISSSRAYTPESAAGFEHAHADLRLVIVWPVQSSTAYEKVSVPDGVGICFVYQVGGSDFADASERRSLVAQDQAAARRRRRRRCRSSVIGIWTFCPAATCASTSDGVGAALLDGVFLMHVDGDCGGCRVAEIVFDRVRYGEGSGLVWMAWYRTVLPDTNTSPLNVFLSYCRSFCRLTVVPSE